MFKVQQLKTFISKINLKELQKALSPVKIFLIKFLKLYGLFVGNMIILLVVACFLLCTSVCTYGIFYYLYVPPQQFEHPVYFDYASENLDLPVSQIDLLHSMHLKKKSSSKRVLRSGVQYSFTLELIVPDSPRNRNAGVWMIEASLLNGKKMITTSKIPTILTYRSKGIRSVRSVLYGIPIVTGLMKESQHISVDLLSNFREKKVNHLP